MNPVDEPQAQRCSAKNGGGPRMTAQNEKTAAHPVLSSTSAQLFVSDIMASCDYFTAKLGFAIDFV
jgi:hypothetical protein